MQVFNGDDPNVQSKSLGRYCGNALPPPIRSDENGALLIRFKSDDTVNAKGFAAVYRAISSEEMKNKGPPTIKIPPPIPINPQKPSNSSASVIIPTGQTNSGNTNINHMINNDSQENTTVTVVESKRSGRGIVQEPIIAASSSASSSSSVEEEEEGAPPPQPPLPPPSPSSLSSSTSAENPQTNLPNTQRQARRQRKKLPKF